MNRKHLLIVLFICSSFAGLAQTSLWTESSPSAIQTYISSQKTNLPDRYRVVKLNRQILAQLQGRTPVEFGNQVNTTSSATITIPRPNGGQIEASLFESSIMTPQMQQQYSNYRTYR